MVRPLICIAVFAAWCASYAPQASTSHPPHVTDEKTDGPPAAVALPDTPVGRALSLWLAAFNTGSLETMEAFAKTHFAVAALAERSARQRAESDRWLYMNLGSMDVVRIDAADASTMTATVKQSLVEGWGQVTIHIDPQGPHGMLSRAISFFEPPPSGFENTRRPTDAALAGTLDRFARKLVEADVFSGVVLVAKEGRAIFHRAYGLARKDRAVTNTVDTRFQLGSVSKMFTAVAIAQFVERGELSFQDSVAKALADYPNTGAAQRMTVGHLLMHSSGLPDYFMNPRYAEVQGTLLAPKDYWPTFAGDPLRFEPGTQWEYSSSNYVVLGSIIERLARRPFRDYIEERVFRPAGMGATTY